MKKILNKKGFTLIELIVVIAILAILAAILIPSLMNYINAANKATATANVRSKLTEELLLEATDPAHALAPTVTDTQGSWTCTITTATQALVCAE
jgi:type IV pilus assembly protein PilA